MVATYLDNIQLPTYPGVAGQQFPRPVLPPGVGAHACHPWLRQ